MQLFSWVRRLREQMDPIISSMSQLPIINYRILSIPCPLMKPASFQGSRKTTKCTLNPVLLLDNYVQEQYMALVTWMKDTLATWVKV